MSRKRKHLAMPPSPRYGQCTYCRRRDVRLTRDHIVPISRGGYDVTDNLADACKPCNHFKGDRLLSELPSHWPQQVLAQLSSPRLRSRDTRQRTPF